jgi:hypothetical protein
MADELTADMQQPADMQHPADLQQPADIQQLSSTNAEAKRK